MSVRALARTYQVSRRTVRSALSSAWPAPRKPMPPRPSKLDPFKPAIDEILRADLDAPRKQRHTVKRIYDRLIAEHDMHDVSYAVVRTYVADRKPKIRVEAGHGPVNVFFPQTHRPGAEAEVDFGEVAINLRGELVTCMLFAFRLYFPARPSTRSLLREGRRHSWKGLGRSRGRTQHDPLLGRPRLVQRRGGRPRPCVQRVRDGHPGRAAARDRQHDDRPRQRREPGWYLAVRHH
jgi:hypothetical protein